MGAAIMVSNFKPFYKQSKTTTTNNQQPKWHFLAAPITHQTVQHSLGKVDVRVTFTRFHLLHHSRATTNFTVTSVTRPSTAAIGRRVCPSTGSPTLTGVNLVLLFGARLSHPATAKPITLGEPAKCPNSQDVASFTAIAAVRSLHTHPACSLFSSGRTFLRTKNTACRILQHGGRLPNLMTDQTTAHHNHLNRGGLRVKMNTRTNPRQKKHFTKDNL